MALYHHKVVNPFNKYEQVKLPCQKMHLTLCRPVAE